VRSLLVDNYDSYSFNLFQLMAAVFGSAPEVLANDAPEWSRLDLRAFDLVVVSPGPGRPDVPRDVGASMGVLGRSDVPVLGVCLGHQALAHASGARVVLAPTPRHGHLERIRHVGGDLFTGVPQGFTAVRYHSWCVAEPVPEDIEVTAYAEDGVVMALRHRRRPWWGVQFHPESVGTEHGRTILENFADLAMAGRRPVVPAPVAATAQPVREPRGWTVSHRMIEIEVDSERVFDALFSRSRYAFWLDSARVAGGLSRFSFLGEPGGPGGEVLIAKAGAGEVLVRSGDQADRREAGCIFDVLERRMRERRVDAPPELPFDFAGGYVGYFGYELKAECGSTNRHTSGQPDAQWMAATRMIAVDHETGRTWLLAVHPDGDDAERTARAWLDRAWRVLAIAGRCEPPLGRQILRTSTRLVEPEAWLDRPRPRYLADVGECLRQLRMGESYEICLTNTVDLPFTGSPWQLYRRLRRANPAPYAAYLRLDDVHVLCSSPERFLKVTRDGVAESRPIKGTAPLQADPVLDEIGRRELARSAKTRAENLMIVDLLRNDFGRICETGTVSVPGLMEVESYATVHQLVSTIRGVLRPDVGAVRAVRTCFPAGSMTGAPKLRTMEIIDRMEGRARGIYSGAIGYFDLAGGADLNVVIRSAVVHDGRIAVGAGGAIVLASDAEEEYEEMLLKARSVLRALLDESTPEQVAPEQVLT
jgi:para-aminobenzoate synthetase